MHAFLQRQTASGNCPAQIDRRHDPARNTKLSSPSTPSGSCFITSSSCEPGRCPFLAVEHELVLDVEDRQQRDIHHQPLGHRCSSVHKNGTPFRNPRNSGGSPSGVSRPPQLQTMKMKKMTMWAFARRDLLARSSGRIKQHRCPRRADEAGEHRAERQQRRVGQRRADKRALDIDAAADDVQRAEQDDERDILLQLVRKIVPALHCPTPRPGRSQRSAASTPAMIALLRLCSHQWPAASGRMAMHSSNATNGSTRPQRQLGAHGRDLSNQACS